MEEPTERVDNVNRCERPDGSPADGILIKELSKGTPSTPGISPLAKKVARVASTWRAMGV
jgi:hypothetical protein